MAGELVNLPPGILCPLREPQENSAKKAGLGQWNRGHPLFQTITFILYFYTL